MQAVSSDRPVCEEWALAMQTLSPPHVRQCVLQGRCSRGHATLECQSDRQGLLAKWFAGWNRGG